MRSRPCPQKKAAQGFIKAVRKGSLSMWRKIQFSFLPSFSVRRSPVAVPSRRALYTTPALFFWSSSLQGLVPLHELQPRGLLLPPPLMFLYFSGIRMAQTSIFCVFRDLDYSRSSAHSRRERATSWHHRQIFKNTRSTASLSLSRSLSLDCCQDLTFILQSPE